MALSHGSDPRKPAAAPQANATIVLGLESSCDDTAACVLRRHADGTVEILAERVTGQNSAHAPFGGVVPEIAARAHAERLDLLAEEALAEAGVRASDLDAVAATAGPGLIGGVMAALMTAKGIALGAGVPLVAVNHLEGHALSPRLIEPLGFPYLLLLVSGGHTQLALVEGVGKISRIGSTIDDAAGEAFDKTAKIMGLGFPGGPAVERFASKSENP
ncbi:MAG: tRNA (adenosine(37)-N6)-threonylcarbamoyltransferase complex transferase subunit TsaD, partial [Oceanicaulis sp.]